MGGRHPRPATHHHDAQVSPSFTDPSVLPLILFPLSQRWLKQNNLETPALSHLRRIRKHDTTTTLLLALVPSSPSPPMLPLDLALPAPYTLRVPRGPALTPLSLQLKSSLWPTSYTPPRKGAADAWTRGRARWAWKAMQTTVEAGKDARRRGEVSTLYQTLQFRVLIFGVVIWNG